jgi:two-component system, response regulator RegA
MNLLIIEDDEPFSSTLSRRLTKYGFVCQIVNQSSKILEKANEFQPNYVLLDMKLGNDSGIQFIKPLKAVAPQCRLVILTGFASIATAVDAVKLGADDYLTKPAHSSIIASALKGEAIDLDDTMRVMSTERLEWEHINQVLKSNNGNITKTAQQLNMHRRTLQRKLQKKPVSQ